MANSDRRRAAQSLAWRLRWAFIALFAALLVRLALPGVAQAFGEGEPVVVTARAVAAGATVTEQDVRVASVPSALIPEGAATSPDTVVGKQTAVNLPKATIVQGGFLRAGAAHGDLPAGRVAAAVRLSDPGIAAMTAVGNRVDLLASAGATGSGSIAPAQVLAEGALVLDSPAAREAGEEPAGALTSGQIGADHAGLLLVAVTPDEAELIGGAVSWAVITAVLVG
ncbi:MAG: SAF domain-containing protein [Bifidobacteriaceae bacterium]|nr:SAF domain-containing protein [Bifidobacteriaceae bacterium]